MKLKHIIIISLFLFVLVAGCIEQGRADDGRFTTVYENDPWDIVHDNINNVTIYVHHGCYEYSIYAIPDYELKKPANYTEV